MSTSTHTDLAVDFDHLMTGAAGDVTELYCRCRDAGVFWSPRVSGWVVAAHEHVRGVLRDEERFPPLQSGPGTTAVYGRNVLQMTGEEHRRKVAPLARRLRSARFFENEIRDVATGTLAERLEDLGPSGEADLKAALFTPFPMTVISRLMAMEEAAGFRDLYGSVVAAATSNVTGDPEISRRGEEARAAVYELLRPVVRDRSVTPGDDLLSELCTMQYGGRPIPEDEVLAYALFLFVAGVETTERTLCNLFLHLVSHPDDWQRLRHDRSLVNAAIAEALRFTPPVHALTRGVAVATTIGTQPVEPGDRILVVLGAANRDPAVFGRPDEFVLDRFQADAPRQFTAAGTILSFGSGLHHCTGSMLARLEMELAVNALLDRYSTITWAEGVPPDQRGYVLRAPASVRVRVESDPAHAA